MKVKQGKKTRKSMAMYQHVFGFRTPYRVLCDGNFLQAALDMKLFVKDLLPKTLLGPCVPVVSKCIRGELQQLGFNSFMLGGSNFGVTYGARLDPLTMHELQLPPVAG